MSQQELKFLNSPVIIRFDPKIIATNGFLMDSGTVPHHIQHTKRLPKSDQ